MTSSTAFVRGFPFGTGTANTSAEVWYVLPSGETDITANGVWRFRVDGNDLVWERRESGAWVEKERKLP